MASPPARRVDGVRGRNYVVPSRLEAPIRGSTDEETRV